MGAPSSGEIPGDVPQWAPPAFTRIVQVTNVNSGVLRDRIAGLLRERVGSRERRPDHAR